MRTHLPFLSAAVGIVALLCTTVVPSSTETQSQIQGSREQRSEIVIKDRAFFLAKGGLLQVGTPLEIVVENRDKVRHGFTSPMLIGLLVSGEDDQIRDVWEGRGRILRESRKDSGDPVHNRKSGELSFPL